MKQIFKLMAGALFVGLTFSACSPEDFNGADENGIPSMEGVDFNVTVDQTTNTMTATAPDIAGEYPVWLIDGKKYSTLPSVTYSNKVKGTYSIELHMANKNGFSQAGLKKEFTFNETKVDFTPYAEKLKGKSWRIDNSVKGHLGCGPSGTSGTEWWAVSKDEKKDYSIYDDRITFTPAEGSATTGTYTYSSGDDGKTFVNTGTTKWGTESADWDATIAATQTAHYTLESGTWTDAEGKAQEAIFLVLDDNTLFPYISSDKQFEHPRFRIEGLTSTAMDLVYDNGDIAWHFKLTSKEPSSGDEPLNPDDDPEKIDWCSVNSDLNLGKAFNSFGQMTFWWADNNWAQLANPEFAFKDGVYTISFDGQPGGLEWQAQCMIHTADEGVPFTYESGQTYDISFKLKTNVDIPRFTLKIADQKDDKNSLCNNNAMTAEMGTNTIRVPNVKATTSSTSSKFILDFGGIPADPTVSISDIIIQKHALKK
jgi:hypothetical protein